jgi:hypothetical protein
VAIWTGKREEGMKVTPDFWLGPYGDVIYHITKMRTSQLWGREMLYNKEIGWSLFSVSGR